MEFCIGGIKVFSFGELFKEETTEKIAVCNFINNQSFFTWKIRKVSKTLCAFTGNIRTK